MAKGWRGTREEREIFREISKHPVGTSAMEIFNNFDSQTWATLKSANRINGTTKEWSVYRTLCRMLKDSTTLVKAEEFRNQPVITPVEPSLQTELEQIIEDAIVYLNAEVQKSMIKISQETLQRMQNKINDLSYTKKAE